jgi:hypothetical protein
MSGKHALTVAGVATAALLGLTAGAARAQNACAAQKNTCVAQRLAGLLKCYKTAAKKGGEANRKGCIDKVLAKFDGGSNPARGCFARVEAKNPPGSRGACDVYGDTDSFAAKVGSCVQDLVEDLAPAPLPVGPQCAASTPCGPAEPEGVCPPGRTCSDGVCQVVPCADVRFEPNESARAAATAPPGPVAGLELCAGDVDWYRLMLPPGTLATLGVTFEHAAGDLDLTAYDHRGRCLGGRVREECCWSEREFETGDESLGVVNAAVSGTRTYAWKVESAGRATNVYSLTSRLAAWSDGRDCTPTFSDAECQGGGSFATLDLLPFPFPDPADGYVGDGYRFDSIANYRWARRELIMLVRYAIHETQRKFPATEPLGLGDISQRDGITPGYDVDAPRHPESTHDQGSNIDLAYYTTLVTDGLLPYNRTRIICDPDEGSNDGAFCTPGAAGTHVVDLARQVYFLARLFESPRLRVIGVDQVIGPLLRQEADRQLGLRWISQAARDAFYSKLAYGEGWQFHHFRVHVSLRWWGT